MAIVLASIPVGFSARTDCAFSMRRVQKRAGSTQKINSAYRSNTAQYALFTENYTRNYLASAKFDRKWYSGSYWWRKKGNTVDVAPPGKSDHNLGIAIDVSTSSDIQDMLLFQGDEHGFERTIPWEPWHWKYVPENDQWRKYIMALQVALEVTKSNAWGGVLDRAVLALRDAAFHGNYGDTDTERKYLQRRVDVDPDGDIGPATKAAVKAHVKQLQTYMKGLHLYLGAIDGDWGTSTETAFRSFRRIGHTP